MSEVQAILDCVSEQVPSGLFVLSTAYEGRRAGLVVRWVQRCAVEPPMVMVAIPRGQPVEPLILDSRCFTLCCINPAERLVLRRFEAPAAECNEDPFVAISTVNAPSGCPIIDRATCFIDCEVARHVELESDHRVYVGQVNAAGLISLASNGFARNGVMKTWVRPRTESR